jgi:hypothetical protein
MTLASVDLPVPEGPKSRMPRAYGSDAAAMLARSSLAASDRPGARRSRTLRSKSSRLSLNQCEPWA